MKEATGETSMTVVTIVLIGLVLAVVTALFTGKDGGDSVVTKWIKDTFEKNTGVSTGK